MLGARHVKVICIRIDTRNSFFKAIIVHHVIIICVASVIVHFRITGYYAFTLFTFGLVPMLLFEQLLLGC